MQICSNCMLIARGQNKSLRPNVNYGQDREQKNGYSLLWKLCRFHILVFIKNYLSNQCNAVCIGPIKPATRDRQTEPTD